jgi:hypothetical protein
MSAPLCGATEAKLKIEMKIDITPTMKTKIVKTKMKTTLRTTLKAILKSLFVVTMLASAGLSAAPAQSIPPSPVRNTSQPGALYQADSFDVPPCSSQWINLQHAYRHCAQQLFNADTPGASDCADFCQ